MEILQLVAARGRRWRVADVRAYESCRLVTLAAETTTQRLLMPFDDVVPVRTIDKPRHVGRRRWRRACRALIAADGPPGGLISAATARFDLLAYQLEPAMAVLRGRGTRVLLADEVGLGKTIQAGLVFAELLARRRADRVLVLAPAGLRDQWATELLERFGLQAAVADASGIRERARTLPLDVNPWMASPIAIASIDYVKRPEVLAAVLACRWDVVVVDEAHAAVGDSERHEAVRVLGSRASYVLLLTATPHSGDTRAYEALRDVGAASPDDRVLVFRRTRLDVHGGPGRRARIVRVRPSTAERRMFDALARYQDEVRREHGNRALALSVLDKRAFSSAWSLAQSVSRRLHQLATLGQDEGPGQQLPLPFDVDGERSADDAPPEWPADLNLSDVAAETRLLEDVMAKAWAASDHESKARLIDRLVRRTTESTLVFTEYRDTAAHLSRRLQGAPVLHGGLNRGDRHTVVQAFNEGTHRVLVATDAAGQGLNLHHRCRLVVNLELPWNPARLEQRIGRVDRIGQTRRVHAVHLVGCDTGEADILRRLREKVATAGASIPVSDPIGDQRSPEESREAATTTDVALEALAEAGRLASIRRTLVPGDDRALMALERSRWWVVRARPGIQRVLGHRSVFIYRVRAANAAGGVCDSRLIAIAASPALAEVPLPHPTIDAAVAAWLKQLEAVDSEFWRVRIGREKWIVESAELEDGGAYQSGLFDRRMERGRGAAQSSRAAFRDLVRERLSEVKQRATLCAPAAELMLVLRP